MKKQINSTVKAHLVRSAFYILLLLAACVIPFALAQRNTPNAAQVRAKSAPGSMFGAKPRSQPVTVASKPVSTQGFGACVGAEPATLVPPFDVDYTCVALGSVPGVPTNYGGLTLKFDDPNTLLIGGNANTSDGRIYQIAVIRDKDMHITGFSGEATLYPTPDSTIGQFVDGGVVFGPADVLFVARYPVNQIEQSLPGSSAPDKVIDLDQLGVESSVGSLGFVPPGFPGAGSMKILSYNGGGWYHAEYSPDGNGTFNITSAELRADIGGGPEGIAFVPPSAPVFPPNSTLISQYDAGNIVTAPLDSNGDPIIANMQDFIEELSGVEGAFIDPVTGDFLFSTFGGTNQVVRVSGFPPPPPTPTPTPVTPTPHAGDADTNPNAGDPDADSDAGDPDTNATQLQRRPRRARQLWSTELSTPAILRRPIDSSARVFLAPVTHSRHARGHSVTDSSTITIPIASVTRSVRPSASTSISTRLVQAPTSSLRLPTWVALILPTSAPTTSQTKATARTQRNHFRSTFLPGRRLCW